MLDRRHVVAKDRISSFNPAYKIHNNRDGTGDIEFDFWGARETWYYNNINNNNNNNNNNDDLDDGSGVEFRVEAEVEASCVVEDCPLSLWGANTVTDASPLLPNNHFYSNLSPTRRRQLIEDGRKELMDMIRDMPESTYELSLKDLVDNQKVSSQTVQEKVVYEDESFHLETETRTTKSKVKAKAKASSLSRSASMETDNLLLKMFLPSFLSFKKKPKAENSSKVSPTPSCEESEKPVDKKWWIKRIFIQMNHKRKEDSSNRNRTSRDAKRSSLPGCWIFFLSKRR